MHFVPPIKLNIEKIHRFSKDASYQSIPVPLIFQDTSGFKWGPGSTNLPLIFPWETTVQIPMHVKFLKGTEHPLQKKDP